MFEELSIGTAATVPYLQQTIICYLFWNQRSRYSLVSQTSKPIYDPQGVHFFNNHHNFDTSLNYVSVIFYFFLIQVSCEKLRTSLLMVGLFVCIISRALTMFSFRVILIITLSQRWWYSCFLSCNLHIATT